eukprot:7065732-Alexandrium_andersonii.AAC.1
MLVRPALCRRLRWRSSIGSVARRGPPVARVLLLGLRGRVRPDLARGRPREVVLAAVDRASLGGVA